MPSEQSRIVTAGVKKLCVDFDKRLSSRGYEKSRARTWRKRTGELVEGIHLFRSGSTYGAPINCSVDFRVDAFEHAADDPQDRRAFMSNNTSIRKPDGYCYHHRFNAKTWSTYDRCLEELELYVVEVAEP